VKFGVSLTTIPPRFSSIHNVITSWFNQDYPPSLIVVFIPQHYKTFKDVTTTEHTSHVAVVENILSNHFHKEIQEHKIIIKSLDHDWGPASKYVGVLEHFNDIAFQDISHWVVGDDDVRYSTNVLSRYENAINSKKYKSMLDNSVATNFKVEGRVQISLNKNNYVIPHIQGVDTVMISVKSLKDQRDKHYTLESNNFKKTLEFLHQKCPNSFYQDDYVLSFLVYLSGMSTRSMWNGEKVAHHVNDVSTSNMQMHLHPKVMQREDDTKRCISKYAQEIYNMLEIDVFESDL
jgi:hypothetical protein